MPQRGTFISLEGGEGAGKSTQIRLLEQALEQAGEKVLCTREPGGNPSAEQIRELLVTGEGDRWLPRTEALLMMAARSEHVGRSIIPALEQGTHVLCDRFFDSTQIYQGHGRGLGQSWLRLLHHGVFGNFQPDITLYLDIDPQTGLARTRQRANNETRFESLPLAFHEKVRAGFLALAEQASARIIVIDANHKQEDVHAHIIDAINHKLAFSLPQVL